MRNLPNIEPSAFRPGEYVGYARGVWQITRANSSFGSWAARHRDDPRAPILFCLPTVGLVRFAGSVRPQSRDVRKRGLCPGPAAEVKGYTHTP